MKLVRKIKNGSNYLYKKGKGAVAFIVIVSMFILFGFSALVLDMEVTYNEASKLQNALDSAALAAVRELPANDIESLNWKKAENVGLKYAANNGFEDIEIFPVYNGTRIIGAKVDGKTEVKYRFARVLGIDKGDLFRTSTVRIYDIESMDGIAPNTVSNN